MGLLYATLACLFDFWCSCSGVRRAMVYTQGAGVALEKGMGHVLASDLSEPLVAFLPGVGVSGSFVHCHSSDLQYLRKTHIFFGPVWNCEMNMGILIVGVVCDSGGRDVEGRNDHAYAVFSSEAPRLSSPRNDCAMRIGFLPQSLHFGHVTRCLFNVPTVVTACR